MGVNKLQGTARWKKHTHTPIQLYDWKECKLFLNLIRKLPSCFDLRGVTFPIRRWNWKYLLQYEFRQAREKLFVQRPQDPAGRNIPFAVRYSGCIIHNVLTPLQPNADMQFIMVFNTKGITLITPLYLQLSELNLIVCVCDTGGNESVCQDSTFNVRRLSHCLCVNVL